MSSPMTAALRLEDTSTITDLRKKYEGKTDIESLKAMRQEQVAIQAEHGMSAVGCLPLLLQLPIFFALYQVLQHVANGQAVGMMNAELVASMRSGTIFGISLADRMGPINAILTSPQHFLVILGLALLSAVFVYLTQVKYSLPNMALEDLPETMQQVQRVMPLYSSVGILVAAVAVPVGLLVYWVASNAWTLVQQAVITLRYPTPGTPAHRAKLAREGHPAAESGTEKG